MTSRNQKNQDDRKLTFEPLKKGTIVVNVHTKDIVEPKNKIIKKASSDCLRSEGFGIVIRRSLFDLYPA